MDKKTKALIPRGTGKADVYLRNAVIVERLWRLVGTGIPSKAFGGRKVEFTADSVKETATHAAKTYPSTLAALRVAEALGKAELVRSSKADTATQRRMKLRTMHELTARLDGIGPVKIMVGERANRRILHYCITKRRQA